MYDGGGRDDGCQNRHGKGNVNLQRRVVVAKELNPEQWESDCERQP
jgi:hypothetical protein